MSIVLFKVKDNLTYRKYNKAYRGDPVRYKKDLSSYQYLIEQYVDLCRGRYIRDFELSFYRLFLDRTMNMPHFLVYTESEDVIKDLQNMYWLDDEDIRQELWMVLYELLNKGYEGAPIRLRGGISWKIRDRLINHERFWWKHYIDRTYKFEYLPLDRLTYYIKEPKLKDKCQLYINRIKREHKYLFKGVKIDE